MVGPARETAHATNWTHVAASTVAADRPPTLLTILKYKQGGENADNGSTYES
jgi:hypothetical protein